VRKLTYFVASTIDGYIAAPDGSDPSGPQCHLVSAGESCGVVWGGFEPTRRVERRSTDLSQVLSILSRA
jgi:hypothetical protein